MAPPSVRFKQTCFLFVQRQLLETGSEAGSANWLKVEYKASETKSSGQIPSDLATEQYSAVLKWDILPTGMRRFFWPKDSI